MALALNNLKRVDMPLNKETKPNQIRRTSLQDTARQVMFSYWPLHMDVQVLDN